MPKIIVGDSQPFSVPWREYVAAIMPKNTPVEFWDEDFYGKKEHDVGIFLYSWHYDGVIAELDCNGVRKHLWFGDGNAKIRRLCDMSKMSMQGEGI